MGGGSDKTIPEDVLNEAAEPVYQRIRDLQQASKDYASLLDYMIERLFDPELRMWHLWADSRLNPSGHIARVGALLGAPPWTFICGLRLDFAARLLTDPRIGKVDGVTIAIEAGFNSYSALSEAFKKAHGMTPIAYRKARQDGSAGTDDEPRDGGASRTATGPGGSPTADPVRAIRKSFLRVDGLTLRGRTAAAFSELEQTAAGIAELAQSEELAAEVHARRGAVHHRRAELLVRGLDLDNAFSDLEKAHAAFDAAGELPPAVRRIRKAISLSDDVRAALNETLCSRCATELTAEGGRSVRRHLRRALEPLPTDLEWFQVCCDPCYRAVWEAADKARLGLMDDAWKAVWLVAHASPVEEVPPSLAKYVRALHESQGLTHKGQGRRLELCRLAVETARELGDPLRVAYALCFVANVLRAMGRFEEAWEALKDAREGCQANPWAAAFLARVEGHLAAQERLEKEALGGLAMARSLYEPLDPHLAGLVMIHQGEFFFHEEEYLPAEQALAEAVSALDQRRDPLLASGAVPLNRTAILLLAGRAEAAKRALSHCDFDRATYHGMAATEILASGYLALDYGLFEEALRSFLQAIGVFESLDRPRDKALALAYSIEAYARLGNREKAIESAAEALSLFELLGCKQDTLDAFGKLRQQLEPAVIDAVAVAYTVRHLAQEQGGWLRLPGRTGEPAR